MIMTKAHHYDAVVVGGGLVGLSLGLGLSVCGIQVAVVDAADPVGTKNGVFDGRVSALTPASVNLYRALGVWDRLKPQVQRIEDILVTDGRQAGRFERGGAAPLFLHFEPISEEDQLSDDRMGYIVENHLLLTALMRRAESVEGLTLIAPARVDDVRCEAGGVSVKLADDTALNAPLCLACDGRNSPMRRRLGLRTLSWSYDQMGLVTTVAHEHSHNGIAQEYFLPSGPFAILPMTGNRSSLVWSEKTPDAEQIVRLGDEEFSDQLNRRFGDFLGEVSPVGPRIAYPLSFLLAHRYIADRCALVGDAAHVIHPIAGQGLNLGLKDVAALVDVVCEARSLGLDIGGGEVLNRYQQWRRFDNASLAFLTDGLNRLFASDDMPRRVLRDVGIALVDKLGPARRFFVRQASGKAGEAPTLLRGELP